MEEIKPRKDRYSPDNVYHIRINIGNHPGGYLSRIKRPERLLREYLYPMLRQVEYG